MGSRTIKTTNRRRLTVLISASMLAVAFLPGIGPAAGVPPAGNPATYTLDMDFDEGTLINVNHDTPNQLQLDDTGSAFDFIWVAASARGTIIKIDTTTGAILGEYLSSPAGMGRNPSRTTVDANGGVWSGNRNEAAGDSGSIVKIGLEENGQCVDRDLSGTIETSTGLGDILAWTNSGGADTNGGVSTADDECILIFERLPGAPNARHVSVDANNNVWVAGYPFIPTIFYELNGNTGAPMSSFSAVALGCGGYGGLIDGNNVLWSASISQGSLLRYDISAGTGVCLPASLSYGLGIDGSGFVWNSLWANNAISKFSPGGVLQGGFPTATGGINSRGVAVTPDQNVWVANSGSNTVTRLDNSGALQATIPVGNTPTGVAVDAAGQVWVANLGSDNAMRIDPATNLVDLTVGLGAGAGPYNYSDMTGSTLTAPPSAGTWSVIHDSGLPNAPWDAVSWTADEPGDSSISVQVASSNDGVTFGPSVPVANGADPAVADGQFLKVDVSFTRATTGPTPVLFDLMLLYNRAPDCLAAVASIDRLWSPNHKFVDINVLGVTDADGDPITITVDSIFQDEPTDTYGDGRFSPDGIGVGTDTASVRAERTGKVSVPGNGRVYHISFTAEDGIGGACSSTVTVGVPHDVKDIPIDEGALYDSTLP